MANIMINEICNQNCPYCFASEFVNIKKDNISFANFKRAVDFILTENIEKMKGQVGIIGGEPLLHPQFDGFMSYLSKLNQIKRITVFTNGVLVEKHLDCFLDEKVGVLINVNSADSIGENNFVATENAIDLLIDKNNKQQVTIGLNIYENKDYSFFVKMAEKYNFKRVRLSIVVPSNGRGKKGLNHFAELKNKALELAKDLLVRHISFRFDCNLPPSCIWNEKELHDLEIMGLLGKGRELIPLNQSFCYPVIDILPDLKAIRCFGMSDALKVSIDDFSNIDELRSFFIQTIDEKVKQEPIDLKCHECESFPNKCYGGCLANRIFNKQL